MSDNNNGISRIGNWFKGLQSEFRKIVWLDRRTLGRQTLAVVIVCVVLAIVIAVLDFGIQQGIDLLVNL